MYRDIEKRYIFGYIWAANAQIGGWCVWGTRTHTNFPLFIDTRNRVTY